MYNTAIGSLGSQRRTVVTAIPQRKRLYPNFRVPRLKVNFGEPVQRQQLIAITKWSLLEGANANTIFWALNPKNLSSYNGIIWPARTPTLKTPHREGRHVNDS
jgi:hypothetical protein